MESWDSPVPGAPLGSLWLAAQLHPRKQFAEDAKSFYAQFYNIDIAEALLTK